MTPKILGKVDVKSYKYACDNLMQITNEICQHRKVYAQDQIAQTWGELFRSATMPKSTVLEYVSSGPSLNYQQTHT